MPVLPSTFNWGSRLREKDPDLYNQLMKFYTDVIGILNQKANKLILNGSNPPASGQVNKNYDIGDLAIRTDTDQAWIMTSRTTDIAVTWSLIT